MDRSLSQQVLLNEARKAQFTNFSNSGLKSSDYHRLIAKGLLNRPLPIPQKSPIEEQEGQEDVSSSCITIEIRAYMVMAFILYWPLG